MRIHTHLSEQQEQQAIDALNAHSKYTYYETALIALCSA